MTEMYCYNKRGSLKLIIKFSKEYKPEQINWSLIALILTDNNYTFSLTPTSEKEKKNAPFIRYELFDIPLVK